MQYCSGACHEMQRIEEAQGSHAEWVVRVRRMMRRGAAIPTTQIEPLANYLAEALPPRVSAQSASGSPTTTTLGEAALRPIQTWVRAAGTLQNDEQTIVATLPASDAALVKVGQRVRASAMASRSSMRQARVISVMSIKGSAQVQVHLASAGPRDSYLLEIITEQAPLLSIPTEAIIEEGERQVVYVQRKSGDFQPRVIHTGVQGELYTQVLDGLTAGEQVVTFGSFFIDAEYKMKSASDDKVSPGAIEELVIDYRGTPNPPHAGDNEVEVTVHQANGRPLQDAEVTVTYYMPAMASMNMPEMRAVFPLTPQGSGRYAGKTQLSMGGTWLITVTVSQAGKRVGRKELTLMAK
jgi:hypothetical protein